MCTVLQQHLAQQELNNYEADSSSRSGRNTSTRMTTSPVRLSATPTYSYLADNPSLKRPIDPYDRKISTPNMHFHVPPPIDHEDSRRSRSSYINQLYGRSRSQSRTGMRVLVEHMRNSTPRPKSPHMNNEEPIGLAHYPDGRPPEENEHKPIERDDFPAPPFAYSDPYKRRRHWSEPGMKGSEGDENEDQLSSSSEEGEEFVDEKIEKQEGELRKISTGIGRVFLTELAIEKERRKTLRHRYIDPRSAARSPAANKEPCFRLRYDSPINASPSRIADHMRPWDVDEISGRRSCITPFLPGYPTPSPAPPKAAKSTTLPSRFSPVSGSGGGGGNPQKTYSTDFSSKSDMSSGDMNYYPDSSAADHSSLPPGGILQAPNVYPLHLLYVNNYRLPGDVDRCNLEKHLSDAEFDQIFKCSRMEFYQLPYWKRCELKRKVQLF